MKIKVHIYVYLGTINMYLTFFFHLCRTQIETNKNSEISVKTLQSSDDTNSGHSSKDSQELGKVDLSQEEQRMDRYVIDYLDVAHFKYGTFGIGKICSFFTSMVVELISYLLRDSWMV